MAIKKLKIN